MAQALVKTRTSKLIEYTPINTLEIMNNPLTRWGNEGIDVKDKSENDIQALLVKAGLDWDTLKRPLSIRNDNLDYSGINIPEHYALLRSDTGLCLDVVGNRYEPVNNGNAFSLFKDFLKAGDMTLDTAGLFKEGRYVWGLAKLKQEITLKGSDKTVGYMLISCPHVQGASLVMKLITKRITCWNSYQAALRQDTPTINFRHSKSTVEGLQGIAKKTVESFTDSLIEYGDNALKLLNFDMSFEESLNILEPIYELPKDYIESNSKVYQDLRHAYEQNPKHDPEGKGNTAYDVLNGVTYYHSHMQGEDRGRLHSQFLGKGAAQSRKVFDKLIELV